MKLSFLVTIFFIPAILFAKEIEIRWKHVQGNNGYQIEMATKDRGVLQEKTTDNHHTFDAEPGLYQVRVAALNKFGRPARFSKWYDITVGKSKKKEVMTLGRKKEPSTGKFTKWIPGWPQWQYKKWKSYSYWSALGLIGYEMNRQRLAGNKLADRQGNDPAFLTLLYNNTTPLTGLGLYNNRNLDKQQYGRHQNNQKILGVMALSIWAVHLIDIRISSKISMGIEKHQDQSLIVLRMSF